MAKKSAKSGSAKKSTPKQTYLIHITANGLKRVPYAGEQEDALKVLVGDQSGNCTLGHTTNYLTNRDCNIAHDDRFLESDWPVTAVINRHTYQGSIVIYCQRDVEPYDIEGLTEKECLQVESEITLPQI
jgi:hypothetical protein